MFLVIFGSLAWARQAHDQDKAPAFCGGSFRGTSGGGFDRLPVANIDLDSWNSKQQCDV
jgi:hypothetical protein